MGRKLQAAIEFQRRSAISSALAIKFRLALVDKAGHPLTHEFSDEKICSVIRVNARDAEVFAAAARLTMEIY